jgi:hypothetical protein
MPRLAYWDQEDYDKAIHLIQQHRELLLSLQFSANKTPLAKKRVRVYVARSMFEGADEYRDYLLNDEGKLDFTQEYNESLLDIELDSQALPSGSGLDALTFHWFYPGKWFDKLTINRDLGPWTATMLNEATGNVTYEVTYDPALVPISASVGFSKLLGHIFEGPKMGSFPEATVTVQKKGLTHFTFHLHTFFEKWMNNFSKPYQVGDEFPLNLTLTFETPFDVKPSSRKDPRFEPKLYDGRVDHTDGNPYLGVPSITPENTLQVSVKPKLTLTETMLL